MMRTSAVADAARSTMAMTRTMTSIAPDVGWLPVSFANVYFIGRPGQKWVLVDAGLPGRAAEIIEAAEAKFGGDSAPEAILVTHGHMDHIGSALNLADAWDVPIYAHRLEMPYLTGKSSYAPPDPNAGASGTAPPPARGSRTRCPTPGRPRPTALR